MRVRPVGGTVRGSNTDNGGIERDEHRQRARRNGEGQDKDGRGLGPNKLAEQGTIHLLSRHHTHNNNNYYNNNNNNNNTFGSIAPHLLGFDSTDALMRYILVFPLPTLTWQTVSMSSAGTMRSAVGSSKRTASPMIVA